MFQQHTRFNIHKTKSPIDFYAYISTSTAIYYVGSLFVYNSEPNDIMISANPLQMRYAACYSLDVSVK